MINALAVVAHHDDHLLWMGGTMQRSRSWGWTWTVIAMCIRDPAKAQYFDQCCRDQGVESRRLSFQGDDQTIPLFRYHTRETLASALCREIGGQTFDWVFTHSREEGGEYGGHAAHSEVQAGRDIARQTEHNRTRRAIVGVFFLWLCPWPYRLDSTN
jgi:hypothetical protein